MEVDVGGGGEGVSVGYSWEQTAIEKLSSFPCLPCTQISEFLSAKILWTTLNYKLCDSWDNKESEKQTVASN